MTPRPPAAEAAGRAHVLVVEDEEDLRELLRYNLERDGFKVTCVDSGEQALALLEAAAADLVVLDLMLPGMDGLEVCRRLRSRSATGEIPIVMITARGEEADVVAGLELGADDYITKPFSPRVLSARLRAVLRRQAAPSAAGGAEGVIRVGDLVVNEARHAVHAGGTAVELTATEFKLLSRLVRSPGRVFTRQQILDALHEGPAAVTDRSVDVMVMGLRRKLGEQGAMIETVRGVGYRWGERGRGGRA